MADKTHIEWTDATWNPITGCSVVSPGCTNCYAMKLAGTRLRDHPSRCGLTQDSKAGPVWNGQVRLNEQWLDQPLRWKKPRMVFVCAHGDLFHESVPDEWIDKVFAIMALSPQHTFQVLTKRPERMRDYVIKNLSNGCGLDRQLGGEMKSMLDSHWPKLREIVKKHNLPRPVFALPLPNVWLGVSVEDQKRANERIPLLLDTPAAVRFISAEPLLGPITVFSMNGPIDIYRGMESPLDWVIVGGESGPGARPMHPGWARSLRDQCAEADVAFFFKQWGNWRPVEPGTCPLVTGAAARVVRLRGYGNAINAEVAKAFIEATM